MLTIPTEILKKLSTSDLQELETSLFNAATILDYFETVDLSSELEALRMQVSEHLRAIEGRKLVKWSEVNH